MPPVNICASYVVVETSLQSLVIASAVSFVLLGLLLYLLQQTDTV